MSDDKKPIEQAVDQAMDTFVYAPIGLLFDGPALFPKLVEKGRNQVQVARMMGQMAVQMGQSEAEKRVGKAQSQLRDGLVAAGIVPKPAPGRTPAEDPAETDSTPKAPAKATGSRKVANKKTASKKTASQKTGTKKPAPRKTAAGKATKKTAKKATRASKQAPAVGTLGIPDYDSLSASQVVSRLRGLAAGDLDAVKAYESATRARKTILNRITQLQKS